MSELRSAATARVAVQLGAAPKVQGAAAVAAFIRRAGAARPAFVNGVAGAVWLVGGRSRVVFSFTTSGDRIVRIDLIAEPERLRQIDPVMP
jgi:RNA polymerase sigma-70 factor (ECF subfamily)